MKDEGKLKREITKRWGSVRTDAVAHAQLEYILTEAGLLARPRRGRLKKALEKNLKLDLGEEKPQHVLD